MEGLAGVDFHWFDRWVVKGQGQGHGQSHIRRGLRTHWGLAVVGGPIYVIFFV